jgi:hypothetical protein
MSELNVDANLLDWNEISDGEWKNIILGNGFSINIWEKFGYKTLFELAKSKDTDEPLNEDCIALFNHLGSTNFEDVLRIIYHAKLVDNQLGSPQKDEIDFLYNNTKKALASAVNFAHLPANLADMKTINSKLRLYKDVFTTNYDLIPYWAMSATSFDGFKDYFWDDANCFDPDNTGVSEDLTKIHYLHGAIHLVELLDGKTQKLTANSLSNLTELFDLEHPEKYPLFISEGTFNSKLLRIKRNDYLRFCYEKLGNIDDGLVILGHSLNKDYDQHIIDAINKSDVGMVAVGIWPHLTNGEMNVFRSRLSHDLKCKNIQFFNSESHPLGSVDLHIDEA